MTEVNGHIRGADDFRAQRTRRALAAAGIRIVSEPKPATVEIEAGAWFPRPEHVTLPPTTVGGAWSSAHGSGPVVCRYSIRPNTRSAVPRCIEWPPLTARNDPLPRYAQVITSLHQGGAERIAVTLTEAHRRAGHFCLLITLGAPQRDVIPNVTGIVDLSHLRHDPVARVRALRATVGKYGVDVLHAHLLDRADLALCAATGVPVVVTVHNTRSGWPTGLADVTTDEARLLVGCSRAVTDELPTNVPTRTVWNGIEPPAK